MGARPPRRRAVPRTVRSSLAPDADGNLVALGARRLLRHRQHDRQDAALVRRLRGLDVDVGPEGDLAREAAVVDLHLLVDAAAALRPAPLAATISVPPSVKT